MSYKILMLAACPFPTTQGSQTLIRQLATGLTSHGHDVQLVTYHYGEYQDQFNFPVHRTPSIPGFSRLKAGPSTAKVFLDLLLVWKALRIARQLKPDIIHGHNYEGAIIGYIISKCTPAPLVYHTHNVMHEELPTYFHSRFLRWITRRIGYSMDRWIPRQAHRVLAINRRLREELILLGTDPRRIAIVPPSVWPQEWDEHGERRTQPFVVYTGNLDNYQNLSILIRGMNLVVERIPDATLNIVSHERNPKLEREVSELGLTEVVSFIRVDRFSEVREWILKSAVAVCPRIPSCGYPIKLVNYLAAGRPVVVSKASADGIRNGETGIVVETGDPQAYADAIVTLLTDTEMATHIAVQGRDYVRERHSWGATLNAIEATYEFALQGDLS